MSERACPFPGLLPFQEKDAAFFFGRDRETGELLNRLEQSRFLAVIGVSGSGKSSLVHAGIRPELRFGNPAWRIVEMKLGSGPRRHLEAALGQAVPQHSYGLVDSLRNGGERVLVIVDQFEESFFYRKQDGEKAKEADLFVQQLLRASAEPGAPVYVLVTMRTDYLGHCALFRNLPEALNEGTYLVPRLTRQEQEEAIRSPLAASGVEIDPEVVDPLLNEAEANRDELPVLQHLLKRLWEQWAKRGAGAIAREDYENTGGWAGAIAEDAESVLGGATPAERDAVKRLYQRLTEKGTGERPIRSPCALAELIALTSSLAPPGRLRQLIEALRRRDLLVWESPLQEDTRIDIPHECVTWRWAELAGWIEEEDRDRQRLEFIDQSRQKKTPLAGSALDEARALEARITATPWAGRYKLDAGELARHIEESRRTSEKVRRRTRNTVVGLGLASLAFAALGAWAWGQKAIADLQTSSAVNAQNTAKTAEREAESASMKAAANASRAENQAELALTQQFASRSGLLLEKEPGAIELAALLAAQSMEQQPTFDGDWALGLALELLPRTRWVAEHRGKVLAVAFSQDGKWVATGSDDGAARVLDAATGKEVSRLKHDSAVNAVAFSHDGKWVAIGSKPAGVMEAATGKEIARSEYEGNVNSVAFSPDGKWVATANDDGTARVMEAATGKEVSHLEYDDTVNAVAFSRDGKWVATASDDSTARVMEAATGKQVSWLKHGGRMKAVAFSPDGRWVATGSDDHTARVMEAATGKEVSRLQYDDTVNAVAFSPNGKWVAAASDDYTARVMEAATGREVSRLSYEGYLYAVAFSPDGKWVGAGGLDSTARVMDAATGREISRIVEQGSVAALAFSPGGKLLVAGGHAATLAEVATEEVVRLAYPDVVIAAAFSPNTERVVTGSGDTSARVIEAATGKEVWREEQIGPVLAAAFSHNGKRLATGSGTYPVGPGEARVMDAATGNEVWSMEYGDWVRSVAFSPGGKWLAIGSGKDPERPGEARVVDAATGREVWRKGQAGGVLAVAFSPDGKWLATGSGDNTAHVWEAATGKEVSRWEHGSRVLALAFSPDSKLGASASMDLSARVMEAATGKRISTQRHQGSVVAVAFSRDGRRLATGSGDKTVRVMEAATGQQLHRIEVPGEPLDVRFSDDQRWLEILLRGSAANELIYTRRALDPQELIRQACEKVPRNLTLAEWQQFAGEQIPYRRTCENRPSGADHK